MAKPTTHELMNAIVDLHAAVSTGFARVDARFDRLEARVTNLEIDLTSVKGEVSGLQRWRDRTDERLTALELHTAR